MEWNGMDWMCLYAARIHEIIKGGRCNTLDWRKNLFHPIPVSTRENDPSHIHQYKIQNKIQANKERKKHTQTHPTEAKYEANEKCKRFG